MTRLEAEVLAARLTPIWTEGRKVAFIRMDARNQWPLPDEALWYFDEMWFHFRIQPAPNTVLSVDKVASHKELVFSFTRRVAGQITGSLSCKNWKREVFTPQGHNRTTDEIMANFNQFAAQWTDFFRRGCWLSGCPVEASAHEKAEWMRGFSREEIDAWDLNL